MRTYTLFARDPGTRCTLSALAILAALLGFGFWLQLQLTAQPATSSTVLFWSLMAVGLAAAVVVSLVTPLSLLPAAWSIRQTAHRPRWTPITSIAVAAALILAGLATWLVAQNASATLATASWVAGMLILSAAALGRDLGRQIGIEQTPNRSITGRTRYTPPGMILAAIACGAALLRLPALNSIPAAMHADEASNGLMGRIVADGRLPTIFSRGWMDLPMLGYAWDGLFLRLFGDSLVALRLSSVVLGIGSIVLVGLLGKELFTWRTGLLAAVMLAVYHVHLHFSRDGIHNMQALFSVTLTLYLLVLALRYGSVLAAVGTGFTLSVDAQVYFAARLAFLLVPLITAYVLLGANRGLLRPRLALIGWGTIALVVAGAPISYYILDNWASYMIHTRQVFILSRQVEIGGGDGYDLYNTTSAVTILLDQAWQAIRTFNLLGDTSLQYGMSHPLLDPVSATLLPAALVFALLHLRREGYGLLAIAFICILVTGTVLTIQDPFWPRLMIVAPILALLIGAFLDAVWHIADRIPRMRILAPLVAAGLLIAIINGNLRWYFGEYQTYARQTHDGLMMAVGQYLGAQPAGTPVYAVTDGSFGTTFPPIQFLAPRIQGCDVLLPPGARTLDLHTCPISKGRIRIFIISPAERTLLPTIEAQYPSGKQTVFVDSTTAYAVNVPASHAS